MSARVQPSLLVIMALGAGVPGCIDVAGAPDPDAGRGLDVVSPRSVDGYWLVGEATHDDVLTDASRLEFLRFHSVAAEGDNDHFEVMSACGAQDALGTGMVTPDGLIHVTDAEGRPVLQFAEFTDDHEIEASDSTGEMRLVGWRVEQPNCAALFESTSTGESTHRVQFIKEDGGAFVHSNLQTGSPGNGLDHLNEARGSRLPMGAEVDEPTDGSEPAEICQSPDGESVECPDIPDEGHAQLVECSVQNWTESRQTSTKDVVALLDLDEIYPGALLQGDSFAAGGFTAITIPRSGGVLTLSGLSLRGSHQFAVDTVSKANVTDAIESFLQENEILGTAADASFSTEQVYSADQFAVSLGISASVASYPASISGKLQVESDSIENMIVSQFVQVYYSVNFEPPERPFSVFRDGENFDDPDNQIGKGNPPLYVSNVKYGRQVFFFLRSSYGAELVKAAMRGAASAEAANVEVSAGLTYQSIMEKTSISYVVRGGSASTTLGPIDSATPAEMYDAIKQVLAYPEVANYSASSPGVPIAYTLKYLTDNKTAMTSYATTYDRRDCRVYPAKDFDYSLQIINPDWRGWVNLDTIKTIGQEGVIAGPYTWGTHTTLDLNGFLTDSADHTLILTTYSTCALATSFTSQAEWRLFVDGSLRWHDRFYKNYFECGKSALIHPTGLQYEAQIQINRATGKVNQLAIEK